MSWGGLTMSMFEGPGVWGMGMDYVKLPLDGQHLRELLSHSRDVTR